MKKILLSLLLISVIAVAETAPKPSRVLEDPAKAIFLDIAYAGSALVAVGERGIILRSSDQGEHWQQIQSPVGRALTALYFNDANQGWAVGHDEVILKTDDGGLSWEVVRFHPETENVFVDVQFSGPSTGYVLGTNGRLFTSTDGGIDWSEEILQVEEWYENHLFARAENSDRQAVIAAEKGVIYRSGDGQSDWQPVDSPYNGSFFGATALPDDGFLLYGMSGNVFRSNDAGHQWQKLYTHAERGAPVSDEKNASETDAEMMMGGDFYHQASRATDSFLFDHAWLDDGRLVLVGSGGGVLISDAQVKQFWTIQLADRVGISAVLSVGEKLLFARVGGGFSTLSIDELEQLAGISAADQP
ncbi:MAG: YCF48-related protein [Immundisolibacteraceae bacterium]|nr:YCF48-related protein [Immundisolibacteraceae bacterium]